MKIKAKVEILNVEKWSTNWQDKAEKVRELNQLEYDMKMAFFEICGINLSDISIDLKIED